jgi:hypothetical protein
VSAASDRPSASEGVNRPRSGAPIYLDDLTPGRLFEAGPITVTEEESSRASPPAAGTPRR